MLNLSQKRADGGQQVRSKRSSAVFIGLQFHAGNVDSIQMLQSVQSSLIPRNIAVSIEGFQHQKLCKIARALKGPSEELIRNADPFVRNCQHDSGEMSRTNGSEW